MYYRQPAYYSDFKCIGSPCRFSCCVGWNIGWTEDEVSRLLDNPACSDALKTLVETSFERRDGEIRPCRVILGDGMRCPFLTSDDLCVIQKELGEEYLSKTCREFPRQARVTFDARSKAFSAVYRSCRLSCPEVSKRLLTDRKAMNLVNVPIRDSAAANGILRDSDETLRSRPEYLYRADLFEMFFSLISDRKLPLERALTRGAFIAQMFSKVVEDGQQPLIPQLITQLKTQFSSKTMFKGIDDIRPNPEGKMIVLGEMMELIGNHTLHRLCGEDGGFDVERYKRGEENLSSLLGGEDFPLRNIALNLLMELSVPFYSEKYTVFENYALFMAAFGAVRLNAVSVAADAEDVRLTLADGYEAQFGGKDALWGFMSVLSRVFQSHETADKLISYMQREDILKPTALSVMIQ